MPEPNDVKPEGGEDWRGVRHWDQFMREQAKALGDNFLDWTQGFVTNRGEFVSREEALLIALAQGQTDAGGKVLLSEDLY